ncbi:peritrophin-1-like [Portunus trituberculatus]|uniref:peritrophin-1-like n=1 Tax=Portunus trituberculatus TaxID=210409 RepID=UPI001E1CB27E|nr:peritrophin-1-like [Portunus trituberculatus]XP_045121961.1 peritrophin-1-like [Portunus trituberculatus]
MKNFLLALVMVVALSLATARINIHCPSEVNVRCPSLGNDAVHLPHPHDCSKYCVCVAKGLAYELSCPPTLLWDDTVLTCNWPDNVDCGTRPVQHF